MDDSTYLVRYGLMHQIGRFQASPTIRGLDRGEVVVIQTPRGLELGTTLALQKASASPLPEFARVIRVAEPDDLKRAEQALQEQPARLADCERIFQEGTWPIALIDVEVLPDLEGKGPAQVIAHYLGPHDLDTTGLRAILRNDYGLDLLFEPAGRDVAEEEVEATPDVGCGSKSGGCGSKSGGCGSKSGGCSTCVVKKLARRRRQPLHA